jgi:hypothetical protein
MAKSKFDAVLGQRRTAFADQTLPTEIQRVAEPAVSRGRGRPPGKRTNPEYQQVTIYIPRSLHDQVKITLIQEGRKEFSELVEELLSSWMNQRRT